MSWLARRRARDARAREVLTAAALLVERGWTQGAMARNEGGVSLAASDPTAVRFCVVGAIWRATGDVVGRGDEDFRPVAARASRLLARATGAWVRMLTQWNDERGRKRHEVAGWLRRAAER